MSRVLPVTDVNTTVAQLVKKAKRSSSPLEVQVPDSEMVVVVLPKHELEQLRAIRRVAKLLVTRPRKTRAGYLVQTRRVLREYEKKYGMTSAMFYRRFQAGELDENEHDYFDWRVQYHAYRRMKKRVANGKRQALVEKVIGRIEPRPKNR